MDFTLRKIFQKTGNKGQRKLVFWHILGSATVSLKWKVATELK